MFLRLIKCKEYIFIFGLYLISGLLLGFFPDLGRSLSRLFSAVYIGGVFGTCLVVGNIATKIKKRFFSVEVLFWCVLGIFTFIGSHHLIREGVCSFTKDPNCYEMQYRLLMGTAYTLPFLIFAGFLLIYAKNKVESSIAK